ncbi:MAG: hypothetical protein RLZZ267_1265 [Bacillota bacterium]|jgi:hypothetical protein
MQGNRYAFGLIAITAGLIILLGKLGFFSFFWPLFLLALGIGLQMAVNRDVINTKYLILSGIFISYAVVFMFCNIAGWQQFGWLWPVLFLGVAVGLYNYYLNANSRSTSALYGSIILTVLSGVFFLLSILFHSGSYFIAIVMIALGGYVIWRARSK